MLGLCVRTFSLPKHGYRPEEYEDAWANDARLHRLAIADGASDGFESRLWAQALVQAFIQSPPSPHNEKLLDWLTVPVQTWKEGIQWTQLPWYAEEKARRGAFATFLGVTFSWPTTDGKGEMATMGRWRAIAIGDACLFQIRGEETIVYFPVAQSTDFGTTPPLLSTRLDYNHRSLQALQTREGECYPGDRFVLATDALAAWFLQQIERGEYPWECLTEMTDETFSLLVTQLRQEGTMRNDDVTLLLGWVEEEDCT